MSGKNFLLGATAVVMAIAATPMVAFASDETFLASLAKLGSRDAGIKSIVTQVGDDNNIKMAKGICSILEDPEVETVKDLVNGVVTENFFDIPAPKLSGTSQQKTKSILGYLIITTQAGVPEYCSQHKPKLTNLFKTK
ncbi:hypothetical protein BST81_16355 [Leptolyngbya sp. 'hensonii']|uniref:DUF732 domain-containing protein n=1 Tax=Leptolyngbya sp. 'hensonii' TaxID=1922337 RepID=UPI00094FA49F|nr:DUF732 domain-containing protein [Leptolyngbya sp. 'hensonii']OLP17371.1 hypothetical protein BST81_16355 [Leptolyngbya sp. 'hensonii']